MCFTAGAAVAEGAGALAAGGAMDMGVGLGGSLGLSGSMALPAAGGMSLGELAQYGSLAQGLGSLGQAGASIYGSGQAAQGAQNAQNAMLQMFAAQNAQQAPYRQAGYQGLGRLGDLLGTTSAREYLSRPFADNAQFSQLYDNAINQGQTPQQAAEGINAYAGTNYPISSQGIANFGALMRPFGPSDLKTNLAPNYEFMKQQGIGATQNTLNAQGGAISGNTLKGITDYAENYAGNAYQNAFSNYNVNQTNIFNRLSALAGLGQTANAQGVQAFGTAAPAVSQAATNIGQAQAAGTVGAANAIAGGANNALGWYALGNMMNPS